MVVYLEFESDTASNKTEKYKSQLTASAYWYERPTEHMVTILKPKIDKLSLTLHIHDEHRKAIPEGLWGMASDPETPEYVNSKSEYKGSNEYRTSVSWVYPGGGPVLIQCDPKSKKGKNIPYIRFEFNPDRLGVAGLSAFKKQIPVILLGNGSWATLIENAKITRLDIAVDLHNIDIENLLIGTMKPGKKISYFGIEGKAETNYLNVTSKGSGLYVYDKKQKYVDDKQPPEFGDTPHTRVEVRTSTTKGILGLLSLMNHLKKISLVDIEAPEPPEELHHWKLFQDSCRYRGLDNALKNLPDEVGKMYLDAVKSVEGEIWQPEKLWGFWAETIHKSGLLEP